MRRLAWLVTLGLAAPAAADPWPAIMERNAAALEQNRRVQQLVLGPATAPAARRPAARSVAVVELPPRPAEHRRPVRSGVLCVAAPRRVVVRRVDARGEPQPLSPAMVRDALARARSVASGDTGGRRPRAVTLGDRPPEAPRSRSGGVGRDGAP